MSATIDASCPKCGKRFGWCGKLTDMPNCPRCGREPDRAKLAADQAEMDAFQQLLLTRPNASVCRKQRVAAGLTLGQAAKLLGVEPRLLADVEHGRAEMPPGLAEAMGKAYDCGPDDDQQPSDGKEPNMSGPEHNPADDVQPTKEEWERYEADRSELGQVLTELDRLGPHPPGQHSPHHDYKECKWCKLLRRKRELQGD